MSLISDKIYCVGIIRDVCPCNRSLVHAIHMYERTMQAEMKMSRSFFQRVA